jgi:hypothetical protein
MSENPYNLPNIYKQPIYYNYKYETIKEHKQVKKPSWFMKNYLKPYDLNRYANH